MRDRGGRSAHSVMATVRSGRHGGTAVGFPERVRDRGRHPIRGRRAALPAALIALVVPLVPPAEASIGQPVLNRPGKSEVLDSRTSASQATGRLTVIVRGARPRDYSIVKIQRLRPKKTRAYPDLIKRRERYTVAPGKYRVSLAEPTLPVRITTGTKPTQAKSITVRVRQGRSTRAVLTVEVPKAGPSIPFSQVSVGNEFTCALDVQRSAWCWGRDDAGQGGNGYDGRESRTIFGDIPSGGLTRPTVVAGSHLFSQISAAALSACGLDAEGRAWCWGSNEEGQLGKGSARPRVAYSPVAVAGDHVFSQVAMGMLHTCALDLNGQTWCWGRDVLGETGSQSGNGVSSVFTPIALRQPGRFVRLALGEVHSCALDESGAAWCWGWGGEGQLGTGKDEQDSSLPLQVAGNHTFVGLATASRTTCGIDTAGSAWCWGMNEKGTAGVGSRAARMKRPEQVVGQLAFTLVTGFGETFVARDSANRWWYWGEEPHGYYPPEGKPDRASSPRRLKVPSGTVQFAGDSRGNCALQVDGAALCHTV